jgi:anti-sigma factor RsiW
MNRNTNHPDPATLHAHHDGELTAQARATVEAHLASCAACRDQLEGLRRVSQAVRSAAMSPVPAGAIGEWMRVGRRVDDRRVLRLAGAMTAAAAAVLVAATLSLVMQRADAAPVLGDWEAAVLGPTGDEPASSSLVLARWIATDLASDGQGGRQP